MVARVDDELVIPTVPWPVIRSRLARMWTVRDAPHHSVIGQTRSGKTFLARHGILDTCLYDRVLFIDAKGDDPTSDGLGHTVHRMPSKTKRMTTRMIKEDQRMFGPRPADSRSKARSNWFRLVTSDQWDRAIPQVRDALEQVYAEGNWIIVTDELRYLTDKRQPGLGLEAYWNQIIFRGGSRGIGMVSLTQEPRWVPGAFYTQSSFYWFSRIEDEAAQKRISEVGSSRSLLPVLARIPRRWWIYTDNLEDERFWAYTTVKVGR